MKQSNYTILAGDSRSGLIGKVCEHMKTGWVCVGGIQMISNEVLSLRACYQAMVLYAPARPVNAEPPQRSALTLCERVAALEKFCMIDDDE